MGYNGDKLTILLMFVLLFVVLAFFSGCMHSGKNFISKNENLVDSASGLEECIEDAENNLEESESGSTNSDLKSAKEVSVIGDEEGEEELSDEYRTIPSIFPLKEKIGYISSWFSSLRSKGGGGSRVHKGIDIIVPVGTSVVATADGIVRCAKRMSGYGNIIVIEHRDGLFTAYAHLSTILVEEGNSVKQGDVIGYSGGTGKVTTPHLHYEVRKGEKPVNPVWFLPATD